MEKTLDFLWFMEKCAWNYSKNMHISCVFLILLNFAFSKIVKILIEFEDVAPSHEGGYSKSIQKAVIFFIFLNCEFQMN